MTIYRIGIKTGGGASPILEAGAPDSNAAAGKTATRRSSTSASIPGVIAERPPMGHGEGGNRPRRGLTSQREVESTVSVTAASFFASAVAEKVIKQVQSGTVTLSGRHSATAVAAAIEVGAHGLFALKETLSGSRH